MISCVVFLAQVTLAQTWRSQYYPANWTPPTESNNFYSDAFIQDFSYAGYHSGEKDIPTITANVVDVTKAPYSADNSGNTDVTTKIQNAINKVQSDGGGVVFLPAGTYRISPGTRDYCLLINKSKVILRGAGTTKTFLYNSENNMRAKKIIAIEGGGGNWKGQPSTVAKMSRDLNGPTTVIPVDNTSLFKVGDQVVLRQAMSTAWANEHKEPEWATSAYSSSLGGVIFYRIVKAINSTAKTITIDAPTRYSFKTRDGACVYKTPTSMLEEIGLEDFSIGNKEVVTNFNDWVEPNSNTELDNKAENSASRGAYKCDQSWVVSFDKVLNSWMKNVSTYKPTGNTFKTHMLSNGVVLDLCRGITLDNVYMGYAQYGGGGGNGYGFRIESNDCLIKNSKAEFTRHGFVFSFMHSSGNVLYKNTSKKSGKCTGNAPNGLNSATSGCDFHMWFSPSNLIDNMTFDECYFSAVHRKGVANDHNAVTTHSVFWNTTGTNSRQSTVIRTSQSRYGYIVGTQGNTPAVDYKVSDKRGLAFRYDTDGSRTNPEDKVEGVGKAGLLLPQSLYMDQLTKRLGTVQPPTNNPPTAKFLNPTFNSLEEGYAELYFNVEASDPDGDALTLMLKIDGIEFRSESGAPYEWGHVSNNPVTAMETLGLSAGPHTFEVVVEDGKGGEVTISKIITVKEKKNQPYTGTPISIPGTIQFEYYDKGGQGVSYNDLDPENKGADRTNFRIDDGVDIDNGNGGMVVGWTGTGEWLTYTINVTKADQYDLEIHYSSLNGGAQLGAQLNDNSLFTGMSLGSTSSWDVFEVITKTVDLPAGQQVIRFNIEKSGLNLDKVVFKKSVVTSSESYLESNKLVVFPNPASEGVFNLSEEVQWQVYSITGIAIAQGFGNKVDLETSPKGTYILKTVNQTSLLVIQ